MRDPVKKKAYDKVYHKKRYEEHRDELLSKSHLYLKEHPEKRKLYQMKWRFQKPSYTTFWRCHKKNPALSYEQFLRDKNIKLRNTQPSPEPSTSYEKSTKSYKDYLIEGYGKERADFYLKRENVEITMKDVEKIIKWKPRSQFEYN